MRVITTSGTRNVEVVLRQYATSSNDYDVVITNESTKAVNTVNVTKTVTQIQDNNDLFDFDVTTEYNEGAELSFYIIETGGSVILHRNKIFVTDKVPQNYSK